MNQYNPHNAGNRQGLPQRRSIRLKGYDYAHEGLYFITICCQDRICRFGAIENGEMMMNEYGMIAQNEWLKLPERFHHVEMDVFQIMPNHMHGIISLNIPPTVGAGFTPAQNTGQSRKNTDQAQTNMGQPQTDIGHPQNDMWHPQINMGHPQSDMWQPKTNLGQPPNDLRATARVAPTVGDIVGAYKSLVANGCLEIFKSKNDTMGKLWQRNYYEHIIRNEQSYHAISQYIINNPAKWTDDKFYKT